MYSSVIVFASFTLTVNMLFANRTYPCMAIRLSAPIEIENLLPYDFTYQIIDKDTNQNVETFLRKGGTSPLHVVEIGHLILMNVTIQDTGRFSYADFFFSPPI